MRTGSHAAAHDQAAHDVRLAWWSLALFPLSFLGAFAVGEGLATALGYPTGSSATPEWWVPALAVPPALLVFAVPALAATWFARRAKRAGASNALAPVVVGWGLVAGFVLVNLLSLVLVVVVG